MGADARSSSARAPAPPTFRLRAAGLDSEELRERAAVLLPQAKLLATEQLGSLRSAAARAAAVMTETLASFCRAWSAYVDAFMTNRSQLAASLFPEKSAQMWFGYAYSRRVLEEVTAWLDGRTDPAKFGAHLRALRSPASGLHISAVLWSYNFGCLGAALTNPDALDPERVAAVLDYWRQVHAAYREGGPDPVTAGQSVPANRVLADGVAAELAGAVHPPGDLPVQRLIAGLVSYSWLMECESRQGQFTHGLYPTGPDRALLVREFSDLSGSYYRWAHRGGRRLPTRAGVDCARGRRRRGNIRRVRRSARVTGGLRRERRRRQRRRCRGDCGRSGHLAERGPRPSPPRASGSLPVDRRVVAQGAVRRWCRVLRAHLVGSDHGLRRRPGRRPAVGPGAARARSGDDVGLAHRGGNRAAAVDVGSPSRQAHDSRAGHRADIGGSELMTVRVDTPSRQRAVDPITVQVIQANLVSIVDEMEANMTRTAYSPIVYEVKDLCAALLDTDFRIIAQARGGMPIFLADMGAPVKAAMDQFADEGIAPGDVIVTNAPAASGQHLNNVVVFSAVFASGEHVGYAAVRAHWSDVGGSVPGSFSTVSGDIYAEGLILDSIKLIRGGVEDPEIRRLIEANIRYPTDTFGDFRAQVAACRIGERRLAALSDRYGADDVLAAVAQIWQRSEDNARRRLAATPDGVYEAHTFLDDDGRSSDPVDVNVRIIISGDSMTIDLSDCSPQVSGNINCGESAAFAAVRVAFKMFTSPGTSADEGSFRPLKMILPPGRFISAHGHRPQSHQWSAVQPLLIDTVLLALNAADPSRVPAGHHGSVSPTSGWGGLATGGSSCMSTPAVAVGEQPLITMAAQASTATSTVTRTRLRARSKRRCTPCGIEHYRLETDTGGPGKWRGGPATAKAYRALQDVHVTFAFERERCPPWGKDGGGPGTYNHLRRYDDRGQVIERLAKYTPCPEGSVVEMVSGSGEAAGPPRIGIRHEPPTTSETGTCRQRRRETSTTYDCPRTMQAVRGSASPPWSPPPDPSVRIIARRVEALANSRSRRPSGSISDRTSRSSSADGGGVTDTSSATVSQNPVMARISSTVTPG